MIQVYNELQMILKSCAVDTPKETYYSMYSSRKRFRKQDLRLKLLGMRSDILFSQN
jgi:hypothetical protein